MKKIKVKKKKIKREFQGWYWDSKKLIKLWKVVR